MTKSFERSTTKTFFFFHFTTNSLRSQTVDESLVVSSLRWNGRCLKSCSSVEAIILRYRGYEEAKEVAVRDASNIYFFHTPLPWTAEMPSRAVFCLFLFQNPSLDEWLGTVLCVSLFFFFSVIPWIARQPAEEDGFFLSPYLISLSTGRRRMDSENSRSWWGCSAVTMNFRGTRCDVSNCKHLPLRAPYLLFTSFSTSRFFAYTSSIFSSLFQFFCVVICFGLTQLASALCATGFL